MDWWWFKCQYNKWKWMLRAKWSEDNRCMSQSVMYISSHNKGDKNIKQKHKKTFSISFQFIYWNCTFKTILIISVIYIYIYYIMGTAFLYGMCCRTMYNIYNIRAPNTSFDRPSSGFQRRDNSAEGHTFVRWNEFLCRFHDIYNYLLFIRRIFFYLFITQVRRIFPFFDHVQEIQKKKWSIFLLKK